VSSSYLRKKPEGAVFRVLIKVAEDRMDDRVERSAPLAERDRLQPGELAAAPGVPEEDRGLVLMAATDPFLLPSLELSNPPSP